MLRQHRYHVSASFADYLDRRSYSVNLHGPCSVHTHFMDECIASAFGLDYGSTYMT